MLSKATIKGDRKKIIKLLKTNVDKSDLDKAIKISETRMKPNNVFNLMDTQTKTDKDYEEIYKLLQNYKGFNEFNKISKKKIPHDPKSIIKNFVLGGKKIRKTKVNHTRKIKVKKLKHTIKKRTIKNK